MSEIRSFVKPSRPASNLEQLTDEAYSEMKSCEDNNLLVPDQQNYIPTEASMCSTKNTALTATIILFKPFTWVEPIIIKLTEE